MLENYRKEWDERLAMWSAKPVKDANCHGADAMRYVAIGLNQIQAQQGSIKDDVAALNRYFNS